MFPAREGRFYDYENWGLVGALRQSIDDGCSRLFCVDGVDSESIYCRSAPPLARAARHRQYEGYNLQEVIPFLLSASATAFAYVHIVFRNPVALGLTFLAGLLFGVRYLHTGSLFVTSFEHALYGCAIFTIGPGRWFYHGAVQR